jgi:hypothetical protein
MDEAVHVATSPHDFKLMVAAAGRPKGEGQAQGPGAKQVRDGTQPPAAGADAETPGVATVAPSAAQPAAPPSAPAPTPAPAAVVAARRPAPSAPPPGS